ncbi:ArsR family transcriptional regulator [Micromonospora pisi]|uniref:ArsR family transcriptional regulator n=1 Tax=Micromonospora pisi TaxID=589240 RepID=A0A495JV93_9ACTN|nr:metalloregulator ArsR/SmtB family transcription factor [Micromonospora pisi]RKR92920.1 ArsR family transcriptional regulator [Micromonospora pisi]
MYARDNVADAGDGQQQLPGDELIDVATAALRMLGEATRLRLMWLLCHDEYDVTALTEAVGVARPAVSQHLGKLRLSGLVTTRRDGRRVLYAARGEHVRRLVIETVYAAEHQLSAAPGHHVQRAVDQPGTENR